MKISYISISCSQDCVEVMLEMGEDPSKEDQVGRGCPEAAILYCHATVVRLILKSFLRKEGVENVSKKLFREIAQDRSDAEEVTKILNELLK